MRNRFYAWLAVGLASALFLGGCPSEPQGTPSSPAAQASTAPAEEPAEGSGGGGLPDATVVAFEMDPAKEDFANAEGMAGYDDVLAMTEVPEPTEEMVAHGKEVFETNCTSCHGNEAVGGGPAGEALDPPPRNVRDTSQYKYGSGALALFRTVKYGVDGTGMAPWDGRMEEADMWAVTHYVRGIQQ